jgi:hypothetical protein
MAWEVEAAELTPSPYPLTRLYEPYENWVKAWAADPKTAMPVVSILVVRHWGW